MYIAFKKAKRAKKRGKTNRLTAKNKAKDRRRVNGMAGRKLSRRIRRAGS